MKFASKFQGIAPSTNLDAPSSSSQNIKDKHADQPAKQPVTPYRIHMLPVLNRCGCKQIILKTLFRCREFCAVLQWAFFK